MRITTKLILLLLTTQACLTAHADLYTQKTQTQNLISIGEAFVQSGNTDKALQLYEEAVSVASTANDKWEATDCIAQLLSALNRDDEALLRYKSLLADNDIYNDERIKMYIHCNMGFCYDHTHDYISAIHAFDQSEQIMHEGKFDSFKPILYSNMAKTLIAAGDIQRAKNLLDTAETILQDTEAEHIILSNVLHEKAQLYASLGKYADAYRYMDRYSTLLSETDRREINNIINSTNPLNMQQKVEGTIRFEKQINELSDELHKTQLKARKTSITAYIAGVVVLLLLCCIISLVITLRRRRIEYDQLTKTNDDKHRIMAIMAHDFITPINTLMGFSELQMQYTQAKNDPELETYSKNIYSAAVALNVIFQNILAWNRMNSKAEPVTQVNNVGSVIEDVVDMFRIIAEDKGIRISVSIDESVEVTSDNTHLVIILRNIISNALKFTNRNGRITISGYSYRNKTLINIEDTGVGMDQETINAILTGESVQSHEGTSKEKGIGIGLSICREFMTSNGGKMDIKSELGNGTSITLEFDNKK